MIKVLLILVLSLYAGNLPAQYANDDKLKITLLNSTSNCKISNIILHYVRTDSMPWDMSIPKDLEPQKKINFWLDENELILNFYTFNYIVNGHLLTVKKKVDVLFKKGKKNEVIFNDLFIPAEWWQSTWFFTVSICTSLVLAAGISFFIYSRKIEKNQIVFEKKILVQKERERIASEMHDEIGSGLLAIKLQIQVLDNIMTDKSLKDNIAKTKNTIISLSKKIREITWSLDVYHDNLGSLIQFSIQQASDFFTNTNIKLKSIVTNIPLDKVISGNTRKSIYLVIQEALQNIIKHSFATEVKLSFNFVKDRLLIYIFDNGKGLSQNSATLESMGMRNMRRRISELEGVFKIYSQKAGFSIEIEIPLP